MRKWGVAEPYNIHVVVLPHPPLAGGIGAGDQFSLLHRIAMLSIAVADPSDCIGSSTCMRSPKNVAATKTPG